MLLLLYNTVFPLTFVTTYFYFSFISRIHRFCENLHCYIRTVSVRSPKVSIKIYFIIIVPEINHSFIRLVRMKPKLEYTISQGILISSPILMPLKTFSTHTARFFKEWLLPHQQFQKHAEGSELRTNLDLCPTVKAQLITLLRKGIDSYPRNQQTKYFHTLNK